MKVPPLREFESAVLSALPTSGVDPAKDAEGHVIRIATEGVRDLLDAQSYGWIAEDQWLDLRRRRRAFRGSDVPGARKWWSDLWQTRRSR